MKKPKNFRELYKIVNPQDLLDVVDFSGINDQRNEEHRKIRRKLQKDLYDSLNYVIFKEKRNNRKEPKLLWREMKDIDYEIIVESLQDFYYWSNQFNHTHAHTFQRVQNALEIHNWQIEVILDKVVKLKNEAER